MLIRRFIAWLLGALVFSGVVAADEDLPTEEHPVELRCAYPPEAAHDFALGRVNVPKVGEVTLQATRKGIDLVVTAVAANGASIGHTETLVRLSPMSPLLIPTDDGFALILIRWTRQ